MIPFWYGIGIITYVLGVDGRNVQPVGPVVDVLSLLSVLGEEVVGSFVDLLDLITSEHEGDNGPIAVLNVINLGCDGGDDAKVVAGTLHTPPKVRILVNGLDATISENNVHGNKLVGEKTMVALKPSVTTSESGTQVADTLAGSSNCVENRLVNGLDAELMMMNVPVCLPAFQRVSVTTLELIPPPRVTVFPSAAISMLLSCFKKISIP